MNRLIVSERELVELRLICFSGGTAAVYIAGVRSYHLEQGYDDPCRDDKYLMMILKSYTNEIKPL